MSGRWEAFRKPLDPEWRPKAGEAVYLIGLFARGYVVAVLLPDLYIISYGRDFKKRRQVLLCNMRPRRLLRLSRDTGEKRND